MSRLLRDRQLKEKLGFSKAELHRRRLNDPDFPPSFFSGPQMRVTLDEDADRYIEILKARAIPAPRSKNPRGRPRKNPVQPDSVNSP
jgi:predicted DNA-binding transcriptional regulator AlpA